MLRVRVALRVGVFWRALSRQYCSTPKGVWVFQTPLTPKGGKAKLQRGADRHNLSYLNTIFNNLQQIVIGLEVDPSQSPLSSLIILHSTLFFVFCRGRGPAIEWGYGMTERMGYHEEGLLYDHVCCRMVGIDCSRKYHLWLLLTPQGATFIDI